MTSRVPVAVGNPANGLRCQLNAPGNLRGGRSLGEVQERQSAQYGASLLNTAMNQRAQLLLVPGGDLYFEWTTDHSPL